MKPKSLSLKIYREFDKHMFDQILQTLENYNIYQELEHDSSGSLVNMLQFGPPDNWISIRKSRGHLSFLCSNHIRSRWVVCLLSKETSFSLRCKAFWAESLIKERTFLFFFLSLSSVISNQNTWVLYELMCWLSLVVRSPPARRSLSWVQSTVDWCMTSRKWGFDLKSNSTNYPDHVHHGDPPLTRKIPMVEPGIEPGTSWLVARISDH